MEHNTEELKNLNLLLGDLHRAIIGDLSGRVGLITQVRELETKLILIEQKIKDTDKSAEILMIKEEIKSAVLLTQTLKEEIKTVRDSLREVRPEIEDTKRKKWIFMGVVAATTFVIGLIKFIFSVILPFLKGKP
jgi:regulator of replication initiation timing